MRHEKEERRVLIMVCPKCLQSGGSLVKVDDHYEHETGKCPEVNARLRYYFGPAQGPKDLGIKDLANKLAKLPKTLPT